MLGLGGPTGGRYPDACESLDFPARQCEAIVAVVSGGNVGPDIASGILTGR